MDLNCRAIYGSIFIVFLLIWVLLTPEYLKPSEPQIFIASSPAERFDYILEPGDDICQTDRHDSLLLLVYVHSAIENRHRRESIRSTWASRLIFGRDLRVIFLLGSSSNVQLMEQARFEYNTYRDVVQQTFIDSYRNLTYKGIMALDWISRHCHRVPYVMKTDDDMLINMFTILNHLHTLTHIYPNEAWHLTLACFVWKRMRVTRDPTSKWFVSPIEYPFEYFENYCSGSAFFITQDLIKPFYRATNNIPFFWIDDYYMTGLLPRSIQSILSVHYLHLNSLYVVNVDLVEQSFLSPFGLSSRAFGHMPLSVNRFLYIWHRLMLNSYSAQKYRNRTIFSSH